MKSTVITLPCGCVKRDDVVTTCAFHTYVDSDGPSGPLGEEYLDPRWRAVTHGLGAETRKR